MKFHPDVLRCHEQFGGDLEEMQRNYDFPATDPRYASLKALLASSQEEIERLRKALEPFARARGHFDSYVRDEDTVDISLRHIRAHHVFAAARALSPSEEQADQPPKPEHGGRE